MRSVPLAAAVMNMMTRETRLETQRTKNMSLTSRGAPEILSEHRRLRSALVRTEDGTIVTYYGR